MIQLRKADLLALKFDVLIDYKRVGTLTQSGWRLRGELTVLDRRYKLRGACCLRRAFHLTDERGVAVLELRERSVTSDLLCFPFLDGNYRFGQETSSNSQMVLIRDDAVVGRLTPIGHVNFGAEGELPPAFSPEMQAFLAWVAAWHFQRRSG